MSPVIEEILRALRENPEVREAVRREILTQELLALPAQFEAFRRQHAEDIARLERQIVENRLAADARIEQLREEMYQRFAETNQRIDETNQRIDQLREEMYQRFAETNQRIDETNQRMEQRFAETNQRIDETNLRIDETNARMEQRFDEVNQRFEKIEKRLDKVEQDVGFLKGSDRERYYHSRAHAIFGRFLTRIQIVREDQLLDELNEVQPLSEKEVEELLSADLILTGLRRTDRTLIYVVMEVSWVIDLQDVQRAIARAAILNARGYNAVPVVGGQVILEEAEQQAEISRVAVFVGGKPLQSHQLHSA
ncbi:MAG: hypothetical protein SNJ72_06145 [Fimbriimonadales bacterium]